MNQKKIILSYLESLGDWVEEYKIRAIDTPFGWIGARGDRDVRQLIHDGLVEKGWKDQYRIVRFKRPEPIQTKLL